jgi:hypothetical protein
LSCLILCPHSDQYLSSPDLVARFAEPLAPRASYKSIPELAHQDTGVIMGFTTGFVCLV